MNNDVVLLIWVKVFVTAVLGLFFKYIMPSLLRRKFIFTEYATFFAAIFVFCLFVSCEAVLNHPRIQTAANRSQTTRTSNNILVPDICACFLSSGRLHLLKPVVLNFRVHMASREPWLTYEIIIYFNGGSKEDRKIIEKELSPDLFIISRFNRGIASGMNTMFFGACRSKVYI